MKTPQHISFKSIGSAEQGFLTVASFKNQLPFELKRVFWTHATPANISRGRHAHYQTEMVLIALSGQIVVKTECPDKSQNSFRLEGPNVGLFLPKLCWHEMFYSKDAVQLVMASTEYDEKDYIRDYATFLACKPSASK